MLSKLNGLIESLNASLSEDRLAESQAVADYNALAGELSSTKGSITSLRSNLSSELVQKKASHAFHSGRLAEANLAFAVNSDLKLQKQGQCQNWENIFISETSSRSAEIQLVDQVSEIIATKLESMKDYIKARAEA